MELETAKIAEAYRRIFNMDRVAVSESSLTRILGKRAQGFCVVLACRNDWVDRIAPTVLGIGADEFSAMSESERRALAKEKNVPEVLDNRMHNNRKTEELMADLKKAGFGYVPVYGGYVETTNGESVHVFERSFLFTGDGMDGKTRPFDDAKKLALELGAKYCQDAVLLSPPEEAPYYQVTTDHVGSDGTWHKVGEEQRWFSGKIKMNDLMKEFFTSINKVSAHPSDGRGATVKRFTYESTMGNPSCEVWFNRGFRSYSEGHIRHLKGERTCRDELLRDYRL